MERLIAIGDIHGCLTQLRTMIEERLKITSDDCVVLLGDYIDRGPQIKETIDYIMNLRKAGYNLIPLTGNHEAMLLESAESGYTDQWFWNGGTDTLKSFGVGMPGELPEDYLEFFRNLKYFYSCGDYLFVHAGFSDTAPFEDRHRMIWTRNEFYTNPLLSEKIIVHGHTPVTVQQCLDNVLSGNKVINIDTGCVYPDPGYGRLTAIELNAREMFLV